MNSKDDSEEKQIILNNLEDEDNKFRAIFAVDQLNEGWDVLNLFDIVRLYNTRDADHKSGKIGKTTMQEAQLIGRGARYCPFSINDQDLFKRKYDHDLENEMRICEELYYHAAHNPKYISELNKALSKIGIKPNKEVTKILKLKDEFRDSSFFKHGLVFTNNRIAYERNDVECLDEALRKKIFKKSLATGFSAESMAFEENEIIQENNKKRYLVETQHKEFFIKDFGINVIRKSLDQLPFYKFSNLKKHFPRLTSVKEFITSDRYLNQIVVEVSSSDRRLKNIESNDGSLNPIEIRQAQEDKKAILLSIFLEISSSISNNAIEFKGTKEFLPHNVSEVFKKDKLLKFSISSGGIQEFGIGQSETTNLELAMDLSSQDWYAFNDNFGTDQEKFLVKCMEKLINEELKQKYELIYLLRNQNHITLYTFNEGIAFEPDFIMFLGNKNEDYVNTYQVFIEPKGENLITNQDSHVKQIFLDQIEKQHVIDISFSRQKFKLIGTKLFNESLTKLEFQNQILSINSHSKT